MTDWNVFPTCLVKDSYDSCCFPVFVVQVSMDEPMAPTLVLRSWVLCYHTWVQGYFFLAGIEVFRVFWG